MQYLDKFTLNKIFSYMDDQSIKSLNAMCNEFKEVIHENPNLRSSLYTDIVHSIECDDVDVCKILIHRYLHKYTDFTLYRLLKEYKNISFAKYVIDKRIINERYVYKYVSKFNDLGLLTIAHNNGYAFTRRTNEHIIKNCDSSCLAYLHEKNAYISEYSYVIAIRHRKVDTLKYLREIQKNDAWNDYACYMNAIKFGTLDIVRYLHSLGHKFDHDVIDCAVRMGKLDIVKYIYENIDLDIFMKKKEWNERLCVIALPCIEMVDFLRKHGHPLSEDVLMRAIVMGDADCIKYLRENDCPCGMKTMLYIRAYGYTSRLGHLGIELSHFNSMMENIPIKFF